MIAVVPWLLGYKIFLWGKANPYFFENLMEMPPSTDWEMVKNYCRKKIELYFRKSYIIYKKDRIILDYISKTFDQTCSDFSAFTYSIKSNYDNYNNSLILTKFPGKIIFDIPAFNTIRYIVSPILFFQLFLQFIKDYFIYHYYSKNIKHPDILYLRKKEYPDQGLYKRVLKELNKCLKYTEKKILIEGSYMVPSRRSSKFDFKFINAFKNYRKLSLYALINTISNCLNSLPIFMKNNIPLKIYRNYIIDSFNVNKIIGVNAKIIFGVLLDKPVFTLLSKYKNQNQLIYSLNEFFAFKPFHGFDYNNLDKYYCMNDLDKNLQNMHGGKIKNFTKVEFFRGESISNSKGLSTKLQMKKEGFSKIILVCLASVPKYNYSLWLENDLIDFLTMVINLIKNNQKYLFILKEKKGELSILSDKDFPQELKNNNCYLIRSNSPRELEHNQFEDLLQSSDLVISQAFTSTTIWQAIHNNIPAVGYNVKHPKSFQHEFKYFIINDNNAQNVMDYWLDIKNDEWKHFKNEINKTVNIGNGNGLAKVAEDIVKSFV